MVRPLCAFPWLKRVHVLPASSPPAQTVLIPRHNSVPFRLPARRIVVPVRPSRLQKMSLIILDETRTRSSPGGSLRERTAAQAFALITTRLFCSHTVRAVECGSCVPPLPLQVPRTVEIDISVGTATFPLFIESLEVRGPPIQPSSHPPCTSAPLISSSLSRSRPRAAALPLPAATHAQTQHAF